MSKRRESPEGEKISRSVTSLKKILDCQNDNITTGKNLAQLGCFKSTQYYFISFLGDSFVVNAFLRRGMEECERYSSSDHKLKNIQVFI